MRSERGRTVALLSMEAALVVAWIATPKLIDAAREQWYLRKLESEDAIERDAAIVELGAMHSAKAAPKLVHILADPLEPGRTSEPEEALAGLLVASTGGDEAWTGPNEIRMEQGFLNVRAGAQLLAKVDEVLSHLFWRQADPDPIQRSFREIVPRAVPELKSLLHSSSSSFASRLIAGFALRKVSATAPCARRALEEETRSDVAAVRGTAELCLALLNAQGKNGP